MFLRCVMHLFILLGTAVYLETARANFFDQGFLQTPVVVTDYWGPTIGTAAQPLTVIPCVFPHAHAPENLSGPECGPKNTVFAQSNAWSMNWPTGCPFGCPNYWTITMNNEPADNLTNPGPPDRSLPVSSPGTGIMGFNALYGSNNFPGDTHWRAHLVLNLNFNNPTAGGIPFLAFGAFSNHGNGQTIGYLNPTSGHPQFLKFDARLWAKTLPQSQGSQPGTITSWLQIFANWGAHPKAVQIALFHQSQPDSQGNYYLGSVTHSLHWWDWRYPQSAYPAAEFVSIRAEDMSSYCGMSVPQLVLSTDIHYSINLQTLFQCLSNHGLFMDDNDVQDPLPSTSNIPVTIVNWANEGTGVSGGLWTDVHSMSMSTTP